MVISNYAEVHERARLCALALRRLGVQQGDRVATVAWNTCRHLESWYCFFSPSSFSSSLSCQRVGNAISAARWGWYEAIVTVSVSAL